MTQGVLPFKYKTKKGITGMADFVLASCKTM